jgi:hypothetical protein
VVQVLEAAVEVAHQAHLLVAQVAQVGFPLEAEVAAAEALVALVAQAEKAATALLLSTLGKQLCQFQINQQHLTIKSIHHR